jgi:hypothetical protein
MSGTFRVPVYELPEEYHNPSLTWARPPVRDFGDSTPEVVYTAIGLALSRWESLETRLGQLFALLVDSESTAAARAYDMAASATARRDMLGAAGEIYFEHERRRKQYLGILQKLVRNHSEAAARRNDIAHGIVSRIIFSPPNHAIGFLLTPPRYNARRITYPSRRSALAVKSFQQFEPIGPPDWINSYTQDYLEGASYAFVSDDISKMARKIEAFGNVIAAFFNNLIQINYFGPEEP